MDKWIFKQTVDLAKRPEVYSGSGAIMLPGDANAHMWQITVLKNDAPAELDGASAMGYFARVDGNVVAVKGSVIGNIVRVTLDKKCYTYPGPLRGIVRLNLSETTITLCDGLFAVANDIGDSIVDPGGAFPTLETLYRIVEGIEARHMQDIADANKSIYDLNRRVSTNSASIAQLVGGATVDPNAEILDVRVCYDGTVMDSAGEAVRSQMADAIAASDVDEIEHITRGHVKPIHFDQRSSLETYKITNGVPEVFGTQKPSSRYMKCPEKLLLSFSDSGARCYLYFYDLIDGEYAPNWEILKTVSGEGTLNYLNYQLTPNLIEIPEGKYMRIAVTEGVVKLYEWDGEAFGPSLSSDVTIANRRNVGTAEAPEYKPETGPLNSNGTGGITIPGSAKMVVCHENAAIGQIIGIVGNRQELIGNTAFKRFWILPDGYDHFKARFSTDYEFSMTGESAPVNSKVTYTGDAGKYISVACESDVIAAAAGRARMVVDIAKKINDIEWTPRAEIKVHKHSQTFKPGVRYNGIPYCSQWEEPRYVGWHVSLRTWLSALADDQSVCYGANGEPIEPYYSMVCSAFAQLCCGWPYPEINVGMLYDPEVELTRSHMPQIGTLWSDVYDYSLDSFHCVVPEMVEKIGDVIAISAHESTFPLSLRTTRYSNISAETTADNSYMLAEGAEYYESYGVAAYHRRAVKAWEPHAPWFNLDDRTVLEGNARPDKGDRSVYTKDEGGITINIKNGASKLYMKKRGGSVFEFDAGAGKVDVFEKVFETGAGVYMVWTNLDNLGADEVSADNCESFEYVVPEEITCRISDDSLAFERGGAACSDFWYALVKFKGHPQHDADKAKHAASVCARPDNDYGAWFKNGAKIASNAVTIFAKGEYGAFAVPVNVI